MIDILAQQMKDRIRKGQPYTDNLDMTITQLTGIARRHAEMVKKINGDQTLTSMGKQGKLAEFSRGEIARNYADVTRPLRKALGHAKAQKSGMQPPAIDRTDLVGEARRREVRDYLRSLPLDQRTTAAFNLARDPACAQAIIDAPAMLTGLMQVHQDQIREAYTEQVVEQAHGPRLREVEAMEEDYTAAQQVAIVLWNELQKASGMTVPAFAEFMAPLEAQADR